jgi:hypothetical protein
VNDWVRSEPTEDAYYDLHKFRLQVYFWQPVSKGERKVKLVKNGKELFLTQYSDKGVVVRVILSYNGEDKELPGVYKAEQAANEILGV